VTVREQLAGIRERLVAKAEDLSIKLDAQLDPAVAAALDGTDQQKARHLFVSQARKLEADLNRLLALAQNFRVHIY
jgi:hypothetical protein